jgi:hypothetical protein
VGGQQLGVGARLLLGSSVRTPEYPHSRTLIRAGGGPGHQFCRAAVRTPR